MRHRNFLAPASGRRRAFTLVELLVVIAIIGTLVGLLLPAVQAARESARNNTCKNNMTQLQKALTNRESTVNSFPGYINEVGITGTRLDGSSAALIRASWIVMTFPYMEQQPLWDVWKTGFPGGFGRDEFSMPELELLICPSDPPAIPGEPNLSYAGNAGFIGWTNKFNSGGRENPGNGVFFDRVRTGGGIGNLGPQDNFDGGNTPAPTITTAYIQAKGDGLTSTILLSENLHSVYWSHDDPAGSLEDEKWQFGICWQQPDTSTTIQRINGNTQQDPYTTLAEMGADMTFNTASSADQVADAFPSSNHPGGVNMAFVGGATKFIIDEIEPQVYCQLMTSNRNVSDLYYNGLSEKEMAPVSDNAF